MRRNTALLLALGGASPAAAWLTHPFLKSGAEESWTPPKETAVAGAEHDWTQAQVAMGWSPRPTDAPKPLFGRMLQPRLDDYTLGANTCGFVSSDSNSFTCISSGATCTFSNDNIGCCEANKDCNLIKTTCIDYNAVQSGACNLPDDFHTLCCGTSSLGACYTWILSTTGSAGQDDHTFTLLDCAATSGTAVLLDYDPVWSSTHSFASKNTASSTSSSDSTATTDDSNAATSSASSSGADSGGSSTNVGAIAGGTVGGVVGLALIGAGIWFFFRRRNKGKDSASPASTTAHMSQYGPVPTGPSGPTSPGGSSAVYPSGVPPNFQGYPPGQYDPNAQYYGNGGYGGPQQQQQQQQQPYGAYGSPSPGYGQSGSPDYNQQHQGAYGGQYNYQPSSMGSPPPPTGTSPSPGVGMTESPHNDAANNSNRHTASELPAVNPIGNENNRAELG